MRAVNLLPRDDARRRGDLAPSRVGPDLPRALAGAAERRVAQSAFGQRAGLVGRRHHHGDGAGDELVGPRDRLRPAGVHVLPRRGGAIPEPARARSGSQGHPAPVQRRLDDSGTPDRPVPDRRQRVVRGVGPVKRKLDQRAQLALIGGGFVVALLLGYFLLISPQRSSIADLQKQIDSTEASIVAAHAETAKAKHAPKIRVADLFRLTKAMPDRIDQADMVLELNHTAEQAGINFDSIKPALPVAETG